MKLWELRKLSVLAMCLFMVVNVSAQKFPGDRWAYNRFPENDGWGLMELMGLNQYIIDSTHFTGFMIVHNGEIVFEYGDTEEVSYIGVCRQSILSILYGKYVENGVIDLDKTLGELGIEDVKPLLPIEKRATVRNLLEARSGIYLEDAYSGQVLSYAPERESKEPGNHWLFTNWNVDAAGYIFEKLTGRGIYSEIENQLVNPLQFQDWDRSLQKKVGNPSISNFEAYPVWLSTRDMARVGLMMLNKGKWNEDQVVSANWIEETTKSFTNFEEVNANFPFFRRINKKYGYGLMWWIPEGNYGKNFEGAFVTFGSMGQCIAVFPAINTVISYKTHNKYLRNNSNAIRVGILERAINIYK